MHKLISFPPKHNSTQISIIVERRDFGSESLCNLTKLIWLRVKKPGLEFVFPIPNPTPLYSILLTFSSVSGVGEQWSEETGMGQQKQNSFGTKQIFHLNWEASLFISYWGDFQSPRKSRFRPACESKKVTRCSRWQPWIWGQRHELIPT